MKKWNPFGRSICSENGAKFACSCKTGFSGDGLKNGTGCLDLDECAMDTHDCSTENARCVNTEGFYDCRCQKNFRLLHGKCFGPFCGETEVAKDWLEPFETKKGCKAPTCDSSFEIIDSWKFSRRSHKGKHVFRYGFRFESSHMSFSSSIHSMFSSRAL